MKGGHLKIVEFFLLLSFLLLLLLQCDQGLSPESVPENLQTGFSGTIYFTNWPPPDSLKDLRLVAFQNFPPGNIVTEILARRAYFYPPQTAINDTFHLPFYVDSVEYLFEVPAGIYQYVMVAQHYADDVVSGWRAVGQYDVTPDSLPSPIEVKENQVLQNIDIWVDFKNPPIQPFK